MTIEINGKTYEAIEVIGLAVIARAQGYEGKMLALKRRLGMFPPLPRLPRDASEEQIEAAFLDDAYQAKRDKYFSEAVPDDTEALVKLADNWMAYCRLVFVDASGLEWEKIEIGDDLRVQDFFVNVLRLKVMKSGNGQKSSADSEVLTALPQN